MAYTPKQPKNLKGLVTALSVFEAAYQEHKKATSALGKTKREAKNLLVAFNQGEGLPHNTPVTIDGITYKFDTAVSEKIDPQEWYSLWLKKEITKEQFFDALSVNKEDAGLAAGADIVASITKPMPGQTADVRRDDKLHAGEQGVTVRAEPNKPKGILRRPIASTTLQVPVIPKVRKVLLRGKR